MPIHQLHHNHFTWTDMVNPTQADIDQLVRQYPFIHPLNQEDLISQIERPKVDEQEQYLFVVMQFPVFDRTERITRPSEVDFIIGRNFLVTAHEGSLPPLVKLYDQCAQNEAARQKLMARGSNDAFYMVADQLVDYIFPILNKVDNNVHRIEDGIFTENARLIISDIAIVRRDIIALRRIIRHLVPILETMEKTEHPIIREELEEYFGDTVDHIHLARDIMDENAEIIAGLADTANTLVSNRINEVMRILTVISVIILPLSLVTGIYGMNINLPLDEHPGAFIVVMGIMLIISITMILYFLRRKWI